MHRNGLVVGLIGAAGLACGGFGTPPAPARVEAVQAAPAAAEASPSVVCCSLHDHAEWTTLADCTQRNGVRWWRYDLCGSADATFELLEPTADVGVCGYTHQDGSGKAVLVEAVSTNEGVITLNGAQRRLKLTFAPAFEGPPGAYVYEDRDEDVRVDVVRDEVNQTATLNVYWGGLLEHRSTRTRFEPCGD